jgi:hypothetical protein
MTCVSVMPCVDTSVGMCIKIRPLRLTLRLFVTGTQHSIFRCMRKGIAWYFCLERHFAIVSKRYSWLSCAMVPYSCHHRYCQGYIQRYWKGHCQIRDSWLYQRPCGTMLAYGKLADTHTIEKPMSLCRRAACVSHGTWRRCRRCVLTANILAKLP